MTDQPAGILQTQLIALGERMDQGFSRLEKRIDEFEGRVRAVENREASCQPLIVSRLGAAETKSNDQDREIQLLKVLVTELKQTVNLISKVGSIAGTAIIVWIISQWLGLIR